MPEEGVLAVGVKVPRVQGWMDYLGYAIIVGSLLDHEDGKVGVGFGKTTGDDAAGEATCGLHQYCRDLVVAG